MIEIVSTVVSVVVQVSAATLYGGCRSIVTRKTLNEKELNCYSEACLKSIIILISRMERLVQTTLQSMKRCTTLIIT